MPRPFFCRITSIIFVQYTTRRLSASGSLIGQWWLCRAGGGQTATHKSCKTGQPIKVGSIKHSGVWLSEIGAN